MSIVSSIRDADRLSIAKEACALRVDNGVLGKVRGARANSFA